MNSLSSITEFTRHVYYALQSKLVQLNPREQKVALVIAAIFAVFPGIYAIVYSLRTKSARISHQNNASDDHPANVKTREKIMTLAGIYFNDRRLKQQIMDHLESLLPRNGGRIDAVQFDQNPVVVGVAQQRVVKNEIKAFLIGLDIAVVEAE